MRAFLLVFIGAALAACSDDVPPAAGSADADSLLAAARPEAFEAAFEALAARDALVELAVTERDASGAVVGEAAFRLQRTPAGTRVLRQSGTGTLEASPDSAPRLGNPLDTALPTDPPYTDPASRDQYRRDVLGDTTIGGRALRRAEATLANAEAEQGVRHVVAAVDPATGHPVLIEVDRAANSAVYDEASRVRVELADVAGTWLPRRILTDSRTDVPLAPPRRVRAEWTVLEVDGQPLGTAARGTGR